MIHFDKESMSKIYLGNNYFVHSSVSEGVTINSLNEEYYRKKFVSGGKTPFAKYNTR